MAAANSADIEGKEALASDPTPEAFNGSLHFIEDNFYRVFKKVTPA